MNCRKFSFGLVFIILLAGLITACTVPNQPADQNTEPPTPQPANTDTPVPEDPQPAESPGDEPKKPEDQPQEPPPPAPIDRPLGDTGPWIVYSGVAELYVANEDASGMTTIHEYAMATPYVASAKLWAAPKGGRVAVLELINFEDHYNLRYPYLRILKIPSGEVEFESWLIPQAWMDDGLVDVTNNMAGVWGYQTQDGLPVDQVFAAVGVWNEMAWSHDGTMLAFNAAIDGESADLYLYNTGDGSLLRLTDGPSQSVMPVFSPDDAFIVHGAVETLNYNTSGYGYDYLNVWAARSDGGGVDLVYNREFYGIETVLGWLSDTEYLAASDDAFCGSYDVRVVDVNEGVRYDLAVGVHNHNALGAGKLLFSLPEYLGGDPCPERQVETGVYLLNIDSRQMSKIEGIDANMVGQIEWNQTAGMFYVSAGMAGMYRVSPTGEVETFPSPQSLILRSALDQPGRLFLDLPLGEG